MTNQERMKWLSSTLPFVILFFLFFAGLTWVVVPKYCYGNSSWPQTSNYGQFYRMKPNTVDVLFVGSSVCANGFSPQEIYDEYGIRSYNLGSEQQCLYLSYYWIREAMRSQKPKAVVLDLRFAMNYYYEGEINMKEGLIRKTLDPMRWSPVKAECVLNLCRMDPSHSALSYILPHIRFHERWKDLGRFDFVFREAFTAPLKGYSPAEGGDLSLFTPFTPSDPEAEWNREHWLNREYLTKTAELCRENGAQLILVNLPGTEMNDGMNNTCESYAKDLGVPYYNFAEKELFEAVGAELPDENIVGHMNLRGARKMSRYIGKMLQEEYGIGPVHDEQYEESREYYRQVIADDDLIHVTAPITYLKMLDNPNYCLFFSWQAGTEHVLDVSIREALSELGLKEILRWEEMPDAGYAAAVSEFGVEESLDPSAVITGNFDRGAHIYSVRSSGSADLNACTVDIDGEKTDLDEAGLHVVVYDRMTRRFVDSVCIPGSGHEAVSR